jgi:hypothetical protein
MQEIDHIPHLESNTCSDPGYRPFTTATILSHVRKLLEDSAGRNFSARLATFVWGSTVPWVWRYIDAYQLNLLADMVRPLSVETSGTDFVRRLFGCISRSR